MLDQTLETAEHVPTGFDVRKLLIFKPILEYREMSTRLRICEVEIVSTQVALGNELFVHTDVEVDELRVRFDQGNLQ
jgi:hypothetical protein